MVKDFSMAPGNEPLEAGGGVLKYDVGFYLTRSEATRIQEQLEAHRDRLVHQAKSFGSNPDPRLVTGSELTFKRDFCDKTFKSLGYDPNLVYETLAANRAVKTWTSEDITFDMNVLNSFVKGKGIPR